MMLLAHIYMTLMNQTSIESLGMRDMHEDEKEILAELAPMCSSYVPSRSFYGSGWCSSPNDYSQKECLYKTETNCEGLGQRMGKTEDGDEYLVAWQQESKLGATNGEEQAGLDP